MASDVLVKKWEVLTAAVVAADWAAAGEAAAELEAGLRTIVATRSRSGPGRDAARREHRDGLYGIGWQRFLHAPADVRAAIRRYNTVLRLMPGKLGELARKG